MDDEIAIVIALLEVEMADEMETFDLERDETREVTAVVDLEDQWTQPYVLVRAPERRAQAHARAPVRGARE